MESLIGTTIGGYKLEQMVGVGTTGQVFVAHDSVGGVAALKVLHPGLSLFTKVQPYWEEQQRIGELSHPHIEVAGSSDWSKAGRFFLVMDHLEGMDLNQALVQHSRLSPAQVLLFAGQVCLALEAVHDELRLYHGALKPRNIYLLAKPGEEWRFSTRVTDFATMRLVDASRVPSGGIGSAGAADPSYLAPEQFNGRGGAASDIYALGVILYEALSGRRPFAGDSYEDLAERHQKAKPAPLDNVSAELAQIVLKALEKRPADRFPSVAALREALEQWASNRPKELELEPRILFPKDGAVSGVGLDVQNAQTVRVPLEEIEAVFEEDEPEVVETKEPTKVQDKQPARPKQEQAKGRDAADQKAVPQDDELAAIAEQAGAALRKERPTPAEPEPPAPRAEPTEVEAFFDEDGDLVELPLERSVRAFVANISPSVPVQPRTEGGNGESLDLALDSFVQDAKAWSSALPPPVVDDRALSELAKVPTEPEPEPEPEVAPPPKPLSIPFEDEPAPRRSVAVPVLLSFVVGGALVFGGMKLLAPKPEPVQPTPPTATLPTEPTEPTEPTTPNEPAEPAAATPGADAAAAPMAAPLPDAAPLAATAPDAAPRAAAADGGAPPTAATTPDAAPIAAKPKAKPRVRKPRVRKPRVRKPRVRKPAAAKPVKPKPKKDTGKKGDWVDPFSQ